MKMLSLLLLLELVESVDYYHHFIFLWTKSSFSVFLFLLLLTVSGKYISAFNFVGDYDDIFSSNDFASF